MTEPPPDLAPLLDLVDVGLVVVRRHITSRPSPVVVWCNRAFETMSGYSSGDLRDRRFRLLLASGASPQRLAALQAAISDGRGFEGALPLARRNRERFDAEIEGRPLPGSPGHYVLVVRPAPGVRFAFQGAELPRQAALIAGLVDACLYLLVRAPDGGLRLQWIDASIERLLGVSASDVVASGGLADYVVAGDETALLRHAQVLLSGRRSTVEYRIHSRQAGRRRVRDVARPEFGGHDDIVTAAVGALLSIESDPDQSAQRQLMHRIASVAADALRSAAILLSSSGTLEWAGQTSQRPFGDVFEAAVGQSLETVLGPQLADGWRDWLDLALSRGETVHFRTSWPAPGRLIELSVTLAPLDDTFALAMLSEGAGGPATIAAPRSGSALGAPAAATGEVVIVATPDLAIARVITARRPGDAAPPAGGGRIDEYVLDQSEQRRFTSAAAATLRGDHVEDQIVARLEPPVTDGVLRYWRFIAACDQARAAVALIAIGSADPARLRGVSSRAERWLSAGADSAGDAFLVLTADGAVESMSGPAELLLGSSSPEVIGASVAQLLTSGPTIDYNIVELLTGRLEPDSAPRELFGRRRLGDIIPLEVTATPLSHAGRRTHLLILRDLTPLRQTEETVRSLAYLDPLTGLPNRLLFQDRVMQAIERARRTRQMLAVMVVDLDRFKLINESLGLEKGDQLLRLVAERLSGALRRSDTAARLGADEFMVLLSTTSSPESTARVAQKILDAIRPPISLNGHPVIAAASIGIAMFPQDGDDPDTLIRNADAALSQAKEQGRDHYQFYTNDMNARAFEQLMLESRLRKALENDELLVHYQPQVSLATGRVVGVEALVRWSHPELGMVAPAEFIPLAEETGLIVPIGEWVLRTACLEVRRWHDEGHGGLRLAVNLSARQFHERDLVAMIGRALKETGYPAGELELELTESVIMHDAAGSSIRLRELTAIGIRLAVDDFGTGYSSLSYLRSFPIRSLKIDRTFVRDIDRDPNGAAIAQAIVVLGDTLGLKVVAEGVETLEQLQALRRYGCDEMQGFLFSRPVPKDELRQLLREGRVLPG